jgi:hypothetical protein
LGQTPHEGSQLVVFQFTVPQVNPDGQTSFEVEQPFGAQ